MPLPDYTHTRAYHIIRVIILYISYTYAEVFRVEKNSAHCTNIYVPRGAAREMFYYFKFRARRVERTKKLSFYRKLSHPPTPRPAPPHTTPRPPNGTLFGPGAKVSRGTCFRLKIACVLPTGSLRRSEIGFNLCFDIKKLCLLWRRVVTSRRRRRRRRKEIAQLW